MKTLKSILTIILEGNTTDIKPMIKKYSIGTYRYITIPLYVEQENSIYSYYNYTVLSNKYNYDDLVDEFIKLIYSDKQMFAIINNYLLDPSNETTLNEFNEMQAVRKEAKDLAKDILSRYPLE